MKFDTEHLHHWMQAIRNSENPMRTMDAFWSGQLKSKEWLIDSLEFVIRPFINKKELSIDIHGGWVGVLASMLFQSNLHISTIRSIDIDHTCEPIANMMNRKEEIENRFKAITEDMCNIHSDADIVINTSCEHITQNQYDIWLDQIKDSSLIVLQGNNYIIDEHVRPSIDLPHFKAECHLENVLWASELRLPLYTRYMVIGTKYV